MEGGFKLKREIHKIKAGIFSKIFFGWIIKVVKKAVKNDLELEDLYKTMDKDRSERLGDRLEKNWNNEVLKALEKDEKPSLFIAIIRTFYGGLVFYGVLWFFLFVMLWSSQPLVLRHLISLFGRPLTNEKELELYLTSVGLIAVTSLIFFLLHHINFGLASIGMRIRIAASSLVYRKITRLNQKSLGQTTSGQIVNLLSNDVQRFDQVVMTIHALWVMPFQVIVLSFVIWQQVGISSLAGIISMAILALPLQSYIGKLLGTYRLKISKKTDRRVKLMNEIISGIQVIKMYAWEKPFKRLVEHSRVSEVGDIKIASYLRGILSSCMIFLDKFALCLTVICYVLLGNSVSPEKVFTLAQTYNTLQGAMAIWFPTAIATGAETWISIKRLENFLLLKEKEASTIISIEKGVLITGVGASWSGSGSTLSDITLKIIPGNLCVVVGPVGAGKSSLLQLLLGELLPTTGRIQIGGEVSYSSQKPWLFQSTVRNNILFGQPYIKSWYKKIVKICALEHDFQQFSYGDRTVVGERGVSLSGGQRARINLARAVYRDVDIYLMDDPLSAVDTHVGKHLFEQCIIDYLKGKTRILVTHQLQYLKKADIIIVINDGRIEAQGTFEELSESNLDFTKLFVQSDETEEENEKEGSDFQTVALNSKTNRRCSDVSAEVFVLNKHSIKEYQEESGNDPNSKPFKHYLLASGNICFLVFLMILLVLSQVMCACADFWVAFWTNQEHIRNTPNSTIEVYYLGYTNSTILQHSHEYYSDNAVALTSELFDYVQVDGQEYHLVKTYYAIYIYAAIIATAIILTLSRSFLFFKTCMMSSVNLHNNIFYTLLKAPMRFFDTNPSGRVLNRFSKDLGAIDELLPRLLMDALGIFLIMLGILVNVSISNPYIIIAIVILGAVFWKFRAWYISSAKTVKHLEGITKSPVFSHVDSTLNGIITIRALRAENILIEEFDGHQNAHTGAFHTLITCMSAFGLWLDIICITFITCVTFSFVFLHFGSGVNGSLAGLAISQAMILAGMIQHGMRQTADVINQLTSVERVLQYTTIDQEGPFDTPKDLFPKNQWPKEGLIEFRNVSFKYASDGPEVLRNLNIIIHSGQKIGIVGRTGAGKSSLISALFRLAPIAGSILIDGIDANTLGLNDLRKNISIIPQEPVLFSATLRFNLDPFDEFEDDQLWTALEQVELKESIDSLDFIVTEGGGNFSLGQRQLICLARAILRKNKILILDEATANVDQRTDIFIQNTIRKQFKDCTVLTIAHRLNTIMDSDRVLVMNFGNMAEFDHPYKLLEIPDGYFHKMVLETGPAMSLQLKDIAKEAYLKES